MRVRAWSISSAVVLLVALTLARTPERSAQAPAVPGGDLVVVAQDGSGAFTTIQAALDAVPADNTSWRTILIKNGTYAEKLFIKAGHVALVGEDRDRTRIVFAELRKNWRATHPDDWGAAVVNIADTATDIFLGNLTVVNNYGALHGDHDHQFAIRSGGIATRIWIVHARVAADGGDTLSLWNTGNGMYYHADCDFEGWVDYVCPRGWCYITNSRFVGHGTTASIWHDGSKDPDQKLVVRRSTFDGDQGFALGRNNRDGQFFLLDNRFSAAMADKPIYRPSAPEAYQWPPRVYYSGNARDGAAFPWYRDNLREAAGAPAPRAINAGWTFAGKWDPEGTIPAVLPFPSVPRPEQGDNDVDPQMDVLRWAPVRDARSYQVYFGTTDPPALQAQVGTTSYRPGALVPGTRYFWRIVPVTGGTAVPGPVWSFVVAGPRKAEGAPAAGPGSAGGPAAAALKPRAVPGALSPWRTRIVLVGDSTVTDDSGWGVGFKARVEDRAECINVARNGRSSKSYRDEGWWARAVESKADYILIQFGHNDQPGKGPERETDARTTFRDNLKRYVTEARAAGAVPVLITSLVRRNFGAVGQVHSDLVDYADATTAVAAETGTALIDLHRISLDTVNRLGPAAAAPFNAKKADGAPDTTHLSAEGSKVFGSLVADELLRVVPVLAPYLTAARPAAPAAPAVTWKSVLDQPSSWYGSAEAVRIADNVILYQRSSGGWPKNLDMAKPLTPSEVAAITDEKDLNDSTIDNDATHAQLRFLARVFGATARPACKAAFDRGLAYLLKAQYPNGGWPQYYPLRTNYSRRITFNDNAMIGAMRLLRDVSAGRDPFGFVEASARAKAGDAVARGLAVILKAQVRVNGRLTAWCAQHDEVTLAPAQGRAYEHPSLSGSESVGIVRFLMDLERPSPEIVAAVEGAVDWFRRSALHGLRIVETALPDGPHGLERVVAADASAPPLWARFYDIQTNRPMFSDRDGVIKYSLAEIGIERRTGYSWYGTWPADLLERDYPRWKTRRGDRP